MPTVSAPTTHPATVPAPLSGRVPAATMIQRPCHRTCRHAQLSPTCIALPDASFPQHDSGCALGRLENDNRHSAVEHHRLNLTGQEQKYVAGAEGKLMTTYLIPRLPQLISTQRNISTILILSVSSLFFC